MPIECDITCQPIGQEEFHRVDKQVMRHAFAIHNELGRFLNEDIYANELDERLRSDGMASKRELSISVSHRTFRKSYFADILLQLGLIYELKAADALHPAHEAQAIHYILLLGLHHGKLINFRPQSVEFRFVSTSLTMDERRSFRLVADQWDGSDEQSRLLLETLREFLEDWGAFLSIDLYKEALLHLLDSPGPAAVPILSGGRQIGVQTMALLDKDTAWHISAARESVNRYQTHLERLLHHTPLRRIQWINMTGKIIAHKTLHRS
jgi:GxxExxY protein